MKKVVFVILIAFFIANTLQAQSNETLTNTTIIKMVKAKLSDELIIDEINSSKVDFDLSDASISTLTNEKVSANVIQAMKAAKNAQTPTTGKKEEISPAVKAAPAAVVLTQTAGVPVAESQQQPAREEKNIQSPPSQGLSVQSSRTETGSALLVERPAFSISAISYVNPVTELIAFYNKEFSLLADAIKEWDKKTRASLEKESQNAEFINKTEKALTDKKNASSRLFSKEITDLNNTLVQSWAKQKSIKSEMINEEKALIEELKKISSQTAGDIDAKFKDVSKNVKSANTDPSLGETAKTINIPKQSFNSKVTNHFAPVAMMLVFYQNEILSVQEMITAYNQKALTTIQKDAELKQQAEPLENELAQYLATTKQNQKLKKQEISTLKKQCDNIEKERKQLSKQMGADSDKLAEDLNKMKTEVLSAVKERFADIIQNVEHSYQDKFNL